MPEILPHGRALLVPICLYKRPRIDEIIRFLRAILAASNRIFLLDITEFLHVLHLCKKVLLCYTANRSLDIIAAQEVHTS